MIDQQNGGIERLDQAFYQNIISSEGNIQDLSTVFLLLSFQKLACLGIYVLMRILWPNLWQFQQDRWYFFAVVLGMCSYLASYLNRITDKPIAMSIVAFVSILITTSEAYLVHFWLAFLPDPIKKSYWIYQVGVFVVFSVYFVKYCSRIEFKILSKVQLVFLIALTFVLAIFDPAHIYYLIGLAFVFNIIAYVHSYKTIQFIFIMTHGWSNKQFLRTTLDLYVDNQVLFPLALIDTANFVVDAIGYE